MKNQIFKKLIVGMVMSFSLMTATACGSSSSSQTSSTPPVAKYTVIFDVNAGNDIVENEPDIVRVDSGSSVVRPTPDPTRRGYDFIDWYLNQEGTGQSYDFSSPVTQNNLVIYAKWEVSVVYHNVTFNYLDGRDNLVSRVVNNTVVTEPNIPSRVGYVFKGWFIDEDLSSQYNFLDLVEENFTLFAKWTQLFKVTFDFNYAGSPANVVQELEKGETPNEPDVPNRDEYTFGGWFIDVGVNNPYTFDPLLANLVVYAKWIYSVATPTYTVEFIYGYTGAPQNIIKTVVEGAIVTQPSTSRENYRFLGWYLDNGTFLNRFSTSSTPITSNVVLYGNWVKTYKLTLYYNYTGAINPSPVTVDEGVNLQTVVTQPSRVGYTFAGWSSSAKGNINIDLKNGIHADTSIYALWNRTYIFESEYLDFNDFFGWGFSGNATGTDAILEDTTGIAGVSNGRFVTYLFGKDITLTYEITSDRAVNDATLILRLAGELKDYFIQSKKTVGVVEEEPVYTVKVNGQMIDYGKIYFDDVPSQSSNEIHPFEDFILSTKISLNEGKNTILLITDNELQMGGTMTATAPRVDCMKITTYANLTWQPKLDNY